MNTKKQKFYFIYLHKYKNLVIIMLFAVIALFVLLSAVKSRPTYEYISINNPEAIPEDNELTEKEQPEKYVKWMEFNVPLEVLEQAYAYDVKSYGEELHFDWIKLIAYGAAKNWGNLKKNKKCAAIDDCVKRLQNGESFDGLIENTELYDYYYEVYSAVLSGFIGEYVIVEKDETTGKNQYIKKYGLKVFSPVAKGFGYSHYDDFGMSRSYGYKRRHLGNDLLGSVGTPIIAVEDGYVEALGWNMYGGWRVGIRSTDKKRYYYYAHLRKDHPFSKTLKEGDYVSAGDVIGYLGMTGYSSKENVNNINIPHLHFGMQIIFNEVQKDGSNQIWIDVYNIVKFLTKNKMPVEKDAETKDYYRLIEINDSIFD